MFFTNNKILNDEYDFIFGIGAACSCSETLRKCGLQFQSYPLDWLYGGKLKTRIDLIVNNFQDFINKEDLMKTGEREHPLPCDIYANKKNKIIFNHDFALHQNLDDTYPAVKEKYDRRIKRLYDNIRKSNKILIVYIQTPNTKTKTKHIKKDIIENISEIQNKYPNKDIKLLYIAHKKYPFSIKKIIQTTKNSLLLVTNYRNKDKTTEPFVVEEKALNNIFKNVKLNKKVITDQKPKTWVMQ